MRRLLAVGICLLGFVSSSAAAIDIPWERQGGYLSSGGFEAYYSYEIGYFSNALIVDLAACRSLGSGPAFVPEDLLSIARGAGAMMYNNEL
jgi:hypothetical protein